MGSSCIPHEIVIEILKKVPAQSLLRFRCLSKSFGSLISEPFFIEAHQKNCVAQCLVNRLALTPNNVIYNLGQREEHQDLACPIQQLNQPCFCDFCFMQSINGLVCLWNNFGKVAICNPFTKQYVFLPHQHPTGFYASMTCCSFGFDPIAKKHKIFKALMVSHEETRKFESLYSIFTIGMDNSWREISGCPNFHPTMYNYVHIHGVIYFVNKLRCDIGAFSVRDEKFIRMIPLPEGIWPIKPLEYTPRIVEIKGQVALLDRSKVVYDHKIVLYVLNGVGETEIWVKHTIELSLQLIDTISLCSLLTTINPEGEILLIPDTGISLMFLYDIGTKEWRRGEIHKIYDQEFLLKSRISVLLNLVENIWPLR